MLLYYTLHLALNLAIKGCKDNDKRGKERRLYALQSRRCTVDRGRLPPAAAFSTEAKSDIVQGPLYIGREADLVVTGAVEVPEEVPGEGLEEAVPVCDGVGVPFGGGTVPEPLGDGSDPVWVAVPVALPVPLVGERDAGMLGGGIDPVGLFVPVLPADLVTVTVLTAGLVTVSVTVAVQL